MRGTKYIISQHTSVTVSISTERVNCIQLNMQRRLLLLLKTFRHSICALIMVKAYTLLLYQSSIESSGFNIEYQI